MDMRWSEIISETESRFLYHASDAVNQTNIMTNGLKRSTKDWPKHFSDYDIEIAQDLGIESYKDRIYFFERFDAKVIENYMKSVLAELHNKTISMIRPDFLIPFTVFEIDTSKLDGFEFHKDSASNTPIGAVWTDSGDIPASAIKVKWVSTTDYTRDPSKRIHPLYDSEGELYDPNRNYDQEANDSEQTKAA